MAKVSLRAYNREIESMIDRGQLDEAIAHCQHILKTFPKHLETYRLLGKAYLEYKRYNDAVDIFMRVLAAEPNDFVANVGISIIRDEENKLDDAIWHMERAFEVQPSNPAIQAELQRLYGRRDGIQPPRIRMTRGALAHMYVQGELYPQAISEIKSVLKEDQGRNDMQVLLARAYYKSGQKNDAADAANSVLRRYPYCLDANRVLTEILGVDRPESAQAYRQRVYELDPYAAQVTGTVFQSNEVSDAAVTLEHLDWNGQPVVMQPEWGTTKAITSETGRGVPQPPQTAGAEPDWLKMGLADSTVAAQASVPPQPQPTVVPPLSASASPFESPASSAPAQPTPEEDIPEFLRAAGWGKSTGAFDESKSAFAEEPAAAASGAALEQGDLPDWVKAMMPQEALQPPAGEAAAAQPAEQGELPDWIKNIGTGAISATALKSTEERPDWLTPTEETSAVSVPSSDEQPDWMKDLGQPATPGPVASDASLDWLKGLDETAPATPAPAGEQPDWVKDLGQPTPEPIASDDSLDWLKGFDEAPPATLAPAGEQPEWMKGFEFEESAESTSPLAAEESPDWLKGLGEKPAESQTAAAEEQPEWLKSAAEPVAPQPADELDWLRGLGEEPEPVPAPAPMEQPDWLTQFGSEPPTTPAVEPIPSVDDFLQEIPETPVEPTPSIQETGGLGTSEQERDDSFAWLEALAAKQGASEGLLTKPEERLEQEPEWVKQAKGLTTPETAEPALTEQPTVMAAPPVPPAAGVEELGKSEQERDDSFAWLEGLAAKQGASEGLLTKAEERLQEEPEWVKQAKGGEPVPVVTGQPAAQEPPTKPRKTPAEDLGKSEQERDDSFAWLEALAAKQGAREGLLTKPEDRLQEEPEWIKQAKGVPQQPVEEILPTAAEPAASVEDLGKSQQEIDASLAWLESLAAKQGATEGLLTKPEDRLEQEPEWVKQAKGLPQKPPEQPEAKSEEPVASQQEIDESLAWLENLAAKQGATEGLLTKPEERLEEEPEWVKRAKSEEPQTPPVEPILPESISAADETIEWFRSLEQGEAELEPEPGKDDTAMWLKSLEEPAPAPTPQREPGELPAWLHGLEEETGLGEAVPSDATSIWLKGLGEIKLGPPTEAEVPPVSEPAVPEPGPERGGELDWLDKIEEVPAVPSTPEAQEESLPAWLKGVDEEARLPGTASLSELPGWMRDETGEVLAEPTRIEPTRSTDWQPVEEQRPEPTMPEPVAMEAPSHPPVPEPVVSQPVEPVQEKPKPAPAARKPKPAAESKPEPYREPVTIRGTGMLNMPVDPLLTSARTELSRSNIPGALEAYGKLIKKGRFLDEVIFDLREALDRFPVEVSILQSLGDAYMRSNRLQDALDAYTKAEELLR